MTARLPQVFVIHSLKDEEHPRLLDLQDRIGTGARRMADLWFAEDRLFVGQSVAEALRAAVKSCAACVFLQTVNSMESPWCAAELGAFWAAGKPVVILVADPGTDIAALAPQFRDINATQQVGKVVASLKAFLKADSEKGRRPAKTLSYASRLIRTP